MNWKKIMGLLGKAFTSEAKDMVDEVSRTVDKTIEKAERTIEHATEKAIKASAVFVLIFIGLIFLLVGLSKYVGVALQLEEGLGYVIVGGVLLLLGWFAKLVR